MNNELLTKLSEQVGTNASELFRLAIRQNYFFVAWDYACIILLVVIGLIVNKKIDHEDDYGDTNWTKYVVLAFIGIIIFTLIGTSTYRLVNPQYQAFYDIMGAFRD